MGGNWVNSFPTLCNSYTSDVAVMTKAAVKVVQVEREGREERRGEWGVSRKN